MEEYILLKFYNILYGINWSIIFSIDMRLLILLLPLLVHSAVLETCLRYFTNIDLSKSTCIECRDGYFLKNNLCVQCNRIIKNAQCTSIKAFTYGSNIITTTPISQSNNNTNPIHITSNMTNISNISSKYPVLKANSSIYQSENNKTANITNTTLKKQNDSAIFSDRNNTWQSQPKPGPLPISGMNSFWTADSPILLKLQNCKQVLSGKCIKCFLGYEIKSDLCVKKKNDENKMQNCFVFSEIQYQCVMCQDGYEVGQEGYCKSPNATQPLKNQTNETVDNKTEFLYAKAEITTLLEKIQSNVTDNTSSLNNSYSENKPKNHLMDSQIDIAPTNFSSTFKIQRSFKLIDLSLLQKNVSGRFFMQQKPKILEKPLITLENSNDSFIITMGEDEGCLEYDKNNGKKCAKCLQNFLLNPLVDKCMNINKPIDLGKLTNSNIQLPPPDNTSKVQNNGSSVVSKVQDSPLPTSMTIIASNGNASSFINMSTSPAKPIMQNGRSITVNGAGANVSSSIIIPPSNASNNTNSNITNITNITNNNTTNTTNSTNSTAQLKWGNNVTNSTSNSGGGALIIAKTSTGGIEELSPRRNITQNNTNAAPSTTALKLSSTLSCTINRCVKCKEGNNECGQCEPMYQLYLGKCYDTFSYRLIVKSKMYGQAI